MGIAAAKQCCEQIICPNNQNKVVPLKPRSSTENSVVGDLGNAVPTLGDVIDYDVSSVVQPIQRIAWDTAKQSLPKILSRIKNGGNEIAADDLHDPPPIEPKTAWTTGDMIAEDVVSAVTPSVPYLLNPESNSDDKPPANLP